MRLFIIGNGFDLAHELPTSFEIDFKRIAESNEANRYFWELYQTEIPDMWSDFEYCLAKPDFNTLEEIFGGYTPDYTSDHESDRDGIITLANISGNLRESLYQFSKEAEDDIVNKKAKDVYLNWFKDEDYFLNFNYTHTLEILYNINKSHILHIHGENGCDNLMLGYPMGCFMPEKYEYDSRQKGRGPFIKIDVQNYIDNIEDYYIRNAFQVLLKKCESFNKIYQLDKLYNFIKNKRVDEVIVIGHSCKIDYEYYEYINTRFPNAKWLFNPHSEEDDENIRVLIRKYNICNYFINKYI